MATTSRSIDRYLERYAYREPLPEVPRHRAALVVPCYAEPDLERFVRSLPNEDVLLILVLNASHDDRDGDRQNLRSLEQLGIDPPNPWVHARVDGRSVLVGHFSGSERGFHQPSVGRARKIGADVALRLHQGGWIQDSWIYCTDADAQLPSDYFRQTESVPTHTGAAFYRFRHAPRHDHIDAYEGMLRVFRLGYQEAHNAYAFHAIGSTMTIRAHSYAAVRGVPERAAGEDFHLFNKLAKTTVIAPLEGEPLILSSRQSARTPFGTGAAMSREHTPLQVPHHRCFESLAALVEDMRQADTVAGLHARLKRRSTDQEVLFRELFGAPPLERRLASAPNRRRVWVEWFDGLKAFRWLRGMRGICGSVTVEESMRESPWVSVPDLKSLIRLDEQRAIPLGVDTI